MKELFGAAPGMGRRRRPAKISGASAPHQSGAGISNHAVTHLLAPGWDLPFEASPPAPLPEGEGGLMRGGIADRVDCTLHVWCWCAQRNLQSFNLSAKSPLSPRERGRG